MKTTQVCKVCGELAHDEKCRLCGCKPHERPVDCSRYTPPGQLALPHPLFKAEPELPWNVEFVWLRLLNQRRLSGTGGIVPGAAKWGERRLIRRLGLTKEQLDALLKWGVGTVAGDAVAFSCYSRTDAGKEEARLKQLRANGKRGGRPRAGGGEVRSDSPTPPSMIFNSYLKPKANQVDSPPADGTRSSLESAAAVRASDGTSARKSDPSGPSVPSSIEDPRARAHVGRDRGADSEPRGAPRPRARLSARAHDDSDAPSTVAGRTTKPGGGGPTFELLARFWRRTTKNPYLMREAGALYEAAQLSARERGFIWRLAHDEVKTYVNGRKPASLHAFLENVALRQLQQLRRRRRRKWEPQSAADILGPVIANLKHRCPS